VEHKNLIESFDSVGVWVCELETHISYFRSKFMV